MSHFDFSNIEEVNRIDLKPDEIVVFRTDGPLTPETIDHFREWADGTPLKNRALLLSGGSWNIDVVSRGEEE